MAGAWAVLIMTATFLSVLAVALVHLRPTLVFQKHWKMSWGVLLLLSGGLAIITGVWLGPKSIVVIELQEPLDPRNTLSLYSLVRNTGPLDVFDVEFEYVLDSITNEKGSSIQNIGLNPQETPQHLVVGGDFTVGKTGIRSGVLIPGSRISAIVSYRTEGHFIRSITTVNLELATVDGGHRCYRNTDTQYRYVWLF